MGYVWAQQPNLLDWPNLARYRAENKALPPAGPDEKRVVFFGDSITDAWGRTVTAGEFFPGKPYVNRGISGQTTAQMVVRFQQDVVHLHPAAVVILAGTNDIAGNTGPTTQQMVEDNYTSMAKIATQNGIKVILPRLRRQLRIHGSRGFNRCQRIQGLNKWLQDFCSHNGYVYLDYYSSMADANGGMLPGLSSDGVHPTAKGYAVMAPLAEHAIAQALGR